MVGPSWATPCAGAFNEMQDSADNVQALNVSGMLAGEMVVLSLEGRHPQVARSFVHAALPDSIQLALHRPLRAGLLQQGQVQRYV